MMINTVPSYCVSLELMISESSWDADSSDDDLSTGTKRYGKRPDPVRWHVLATYCAASFLQAVVWNTWSPIASSALFTFPSWTPSTVALLSNWGCITFIFFIVPSCWMLNKKGGLLTGLRISFIVAGLFCTVGSGIRCIHSEHLFTILTHVGAILNAIGGVTLGPAIVLLSSTWFPPNQRTTATGIGTASSLLGMACSYLLGPTIVSEPPQVYLDKEQEFKIREKMRVEISHFLFICFFAELTLLCIIVLLFPDKPPLPPSRSSMTTLAGKPKFLTSIKMLATNRDVWLLGLSAALCSGITGPWFSLLPITFAHSGITQYETSKLGFWTVICSFCLGLSVSKVSDYCQGHLRLILIVFIAFANFMFLIILLLTSGTIPFNKGLLTVVVISGLSTVWSTPALFYEMGAELAYPVPEGIVAGSIMSLTNATACLVYLQLYIFPKHDITWLNYALVILGLVSFTALCMVHEKYNRLYIDMN